MDLATFVQKAIEDGDFDFARELVRSGEYPLSRMERRRLLNRIDEAEQHGQV